MATSEQAKMLQAINTAIEMESDGKECYLAASKESTNEAGRKLLESLAEEEDGHQRKFEELYNSIIKGRGWPSVNLQPDTTHDIRTSLIKTCTILGVNVSGTSSELDAVQVAIDKEKKSYDFYENQARIAAYDIEREFYKNLAKEEREHELALLDYYDYLPDPAGWFVRTEHPSLDGG